MSQSNIAHIHIPTLDSPVEPQRFGTSRLLLRLNILNKNGLRIPSGHELGPSRGFRLSISSLSTADVSLIVNVKIVQLICTI